MMKFIEICKNNFGDVGYYHRDPKEDIYNDSKDFFYYHPMIWDKYADFINNQPIIKDFLEQVAPIWREVYIKLQEIFRILDEKHPNCYSRIFDTDTPHITIRFLKYNWQNSQKYLAKPHFDAGSFTLAITESCPGLRIGSSPEDLKLVKHIPDNAIFMFSSNYEKIIDNEKFSPGWHDVIQMDETQINKPFARWAMVAFIDGYDVEALSRQETHKYYQVDERSRKIY